MCAILDGRRDRIHFFELDLVELPELQLDNREVTAARLTSPDELQSVTKTRLVAAYLAGRQSRHHHPDPMGPADSSIASTLRTANENEKPICGSDKLVRDD